MTTDFRAIFEDSTGPERVAKRLARAGLCSRRDAERWIQDGRVSVDGKILEGPAVTVDNISRIKVDGQPLAPIEPPRLWRYHKTRGRITSNRDTRGRLTIFDDLPTELPRVVTVGRLDFESEGLLLLTNDGDLARMLELPSTGWVRRYRVRVYGRPQPGQLEHLKPGVVVDGVRYRPVDIALDHQGSSNAWITIGLREGRNREIRHLMDHVGLPVNRLIRTSFGPFQLGNLAAGAVDEIRQRTLKEQLGAAVGSTSAPKRTTSGKSRANRRRKP